MLPLPVEKKNGARSMAAAREMAVKYYIVCTVNKYGGGLAFLNFDYFLD